jgi:hypothetical protein
MAVALHLDGTETRRKEKKERKILPEELSEQERG